jgi:hypothetical protein
MYPENAKVVQESFLYECIHPAGLPHVDAEEEDHPELHFPGLEVNNCVEFKERIIRPFIVPWFRMWDQAALQMIRDSFQYYL